MKPHQIYRMTHLLGKNLLLTSAWAVGNYSSGHQLPELLEPSQQEVFTKQMGHPVFPSCVHFKMHPAVEVIGEVIGQ